MSDMTTASQAMFATELVRQLNRLGNFATSEFRVPGTHTRLDIYIASPVRAFVEIKFLSLPSPSAVQGLVQQAERLRVLFGEAIVPILVAGGEGWRPSSTKELRDAGFFVHSIEGSPQDSSSAALAAKKIRNFLTHRPYDFKGIEPRPIPRTYSDLQVRRPLDAAMSASATAPAMRASVPATDIFVDVLVSMKSVLSPEQFTVLEHELAAFSEEYSHAHYTACALRIGRTLEHVVYALAGEWGVSINRTTLRVLSGLNGSFDQLSRALIAYATTDESEKETRRRAVQDQVEKVSSNLYKLVWELDSDLRPEPTGVPVTWSRYCATSEAVPPTRQGPEDGGFDYKREHLPEDPGCPKRRGACKHGRCAAGA